MAGVFPYEEYALLLAPLSGFTDAAYRRAARRCGCVYCFTEMVDAASLAYAPEKQHPLLYRAPDEEFLGTQLVGSDPELLKRSCEVLSRHRFEVLDLNLGCPVPKVVKKGAGAALGRNADLALRCFEVLAHYSDFPLSAKLRILNYGDPEPTVSLCRELAARGAKAITIHGRPLERFYSGPVDFNIIRAVREALPGLPVIANGGVRSVETCQEMRRESGCTRVMLAQGAMGNPWLFRILSGTGTAPGKEEFLAVIREHLLGMIELYGEDSAMRQARKILHDYLKGRGFPGTFRAMASTVSTLAEAEGLLARVPEHLFRI